MKVAAVQMGIRFRDPGGNLRRIHQYALQTEADLVVFPECSNSGYGFDDREEAFKYAEKVPGPVTDALVSVAVEHNRTFIAGLLEKRNGELRNVAALITPDGNVRTYCKSHLPVLGVDRFVSPGEELPVFDTPVGRIGILICYEWRFPEVARVLALKGAQILAGPTCWPEGARVISELLIPARAAENRVWIVSASRVGSDGKGDYIGKSAILDPEGKTVAQLADTEAVLTADIDPGAASGKLLVRKPGEYEIDLFADRKPELYPLIAESKK